MIAMFLVLALTQMDAVGSAEKCARNCLTCYSGTMNWVCTSCFEDSFLKRMGQYYECVRCDYGCVSCTYHGNCIECYPGRHGQGCEHSCGEGCINNTCDKNTGSCQCKEHFTGETCEKCAPGRYGTNCSLLCNEGCLNNTCDKDIGECVCNDGFTGLNCSQCIAGKYGSLCQRECSNGCKDGTCDRKTGQCACKPDYVGEKCDRCSNGTYYTNSTCSNKCPSNCISCESYHLCLACRPGYYGSSCQWPCPTQCLNGICDKELGYCQNLACVNGYTGARCDHCIAKGKYGDDCTLDCMQNCLRCSSGSSCDECKDGFWGPNCTDECPKICKGPTCDKYDGSCSQSALCKIIYSK